MSSGELLVDRALLERFEAGLQPRHPEQSAIPARVMGYGEISTVLRIEAPGQAHLAYKRMPMFHSVAEAGAYEVLYREYLRVLEEQIGITAVPSRLLRLGDEQHAERVTVYIVQELLPVSSIAHKTIHLLDEAGAELLLRAVLAEIRKVFAFNRENGTAVQLGFDGQLSNWAVRGFDPEQRRLPDPIRLLYIDTSSPLMRLNDKEQLDPELFLRSAPSFLRPIIRALFLEDVVTRYYDLRKVTIDLAANLYKEQRADLVPTAVALANEMLAQVPGNTPITAKEVRSYYREDAFIWRFYLAARKIDRSLHQLLSKPYPYLLPDKVQR